MPGSNKRQSRVSSGVFHEDVLAARMILQELRAVVHVIVDHEPAVVERVVPGDLGQIDHPKLVARLFSQPASSLSDGIISLRDIVTIDLQVLPRRFHVCYFEGSEGQAHEIHVTTSSRSVRSVRRIDFVA